MQRIMLVCVALVPLLGSQAPAQGGAGDPCPARVDSFEFDQVPADLVLTALLLPLEYDAEKGQCWSRLSVVVDMRECGGVFTRFRDGQLDTMMPSYPLLSTTLYMFSQPTVQSFTNELKWNGQRLLLWTSTL